MLQGPLIREPHLGPHVLCALLGPRVSVDAVRVFR
jgi:hypothetical protein